MSNLKVIMEGWRSFVKEAKSPLASTEDFSMYYEQKPNWVYIVLYKTLNKTETTVVGVLRITKLEEPSIPKTGQVSSIATNVDYQGQGIGRLLYSMAFYVASTLGVGLTSDKDTGTRAKAKEQWKKFEKSPDYEKRSTKAGNDTFDYDGVTDDPDDDCEGGDLTPRQNATHHSLMKHDTDGMDELFSAMEARHMENIEQMSEKQESTFISLIKQTALNTFMDAYDAEVY